MDAIYIYTHTHTHTHTEMYICRMTAFSKVFQRITTTKKMFLKVAKQFLTGLAGTLFMKYYQIHKLCL